MPLDSRRSCLARHGFPALVKPLVPGRAEQRGGERVMTSKPLYSHLHEAFFDGKPVHPWKALFF